jgi:hypothetical protein
MKRILLLLMLLSGALAGSATTENAFNVMVRPKSLKEGSTELWVTIVNNETHVFNLTVTFSKIPRGITLEDNQTKSMPFKIKGETNPPFKWKISRLERDIEDNFTDAFELSWDDLVALSDIKVDGAPIINGTMKVPSKEVNVSGMTDPQVYSGQFCQTIGLECRTRISISGTREFYAADDGSFSSMKELAKGDNTITIIATDVAGNTENKTFTVTYEQPPEEFFKENIVFIVAIIIAIMVLSILGSIVFLRYTKENSYKSLKKKRVELGGEITRLKIKRANMGLSEEERLRLDKCERDYTDIDEKILRDSRRLKELNKRASRVREQTKADVPSEEIKKQLKEEGYTEREIGLIKKELQKRKENA